MTAKEKRKVLGTIKILTLMLNVQGHAWTAMQRRAVEEAHRLLDPNPPPDLQARLWSKFK